MPPEPRHVIRAQQFDRPLLEQLFDQADAFRGELEKNHRALHNRHAGRILFNVFYEPSTRTRMSFSAAAEHLGMNIVTTENAAEFSSAAKGETLEDSIRVMAEYHPDVIVLRHFETGAGERAAAVSPVPIVNAGDGQGQHPTQALLDLYTIRRERGSIAGVTVVVGGDLAHGRTARSLVYLLSKYEDVKIVFVSPDELRMGGDIKDHLTEAGVGFSETDDLQPVLPQADVVYWTRVQRERFADPALYDRLKDRFILTPAILQSMKPDAALMHPLPRVNEIHPDVDADPRSAYFRQAGNGMYIRIALLDWILADA